MKTPKIVVLTGSGISAPSGLSTFRDREGIWARYDLEEVATPGAWAKNPQLVLDFYNERRTQAAAAQPNEAHRALAELESKFEVKIITQNVDDLHERGGSTQILHLHGELTKARSTIDETLVYDIGSRPIHIGNLCEKGGQLRPHIVWFGEMVPLIDDAAAEFHDADRVLVIGTSLTVYPAAGLVELAPLHAQKFLVDTDTHSVPRVFSLIQESAEIGVPALVKRWLEEA
jgi:NAD-dependent deacetylase